MFSGMQLPATGAQQPWLTMASPPPPQQQQRAQHHHHHHPRSSGMRRGVETLAEGGEVGGEDEGNASLSSLSSTWPSNLLPTTHVLGGIRWRTLVDNLVVELLSSLFVNLVTILCWTASTTDPLQFMPSVTLALVLVCIKDEDYFFPDTSPTVTFVLWVLGGYTWIHVVARLIGQLIGFAIAAWICLYTALPALDYRVEHPLTVIFALEVIGTTMEHMAVVYVILPLLPPAHVHLAYPSLQQQQRGIPRVKAKSHHETQAPSNPMVMHAAFTFAGLHWCLSRGFCIEMSPMVTLLVLLLRCNAKDAGDRIGLFWSVATISLWAQVVGVLTCVAYVALFAPRARSQVPQEEEPKLSATYGSRSTRGPFSSFSNR